jgi:hypothetical protein
MKVTIDIDCSPEEARAFLGLPAVAAMQEAILKEMQKRLLENVGAMDPESLMKQWFPAGREGWEQMQKAFWSQFPGGPAGKPGGKP